MRTSWPNFSEDELACSCCGALNRNPEFETLMDDVQLFREQTGKAVPITSGYRCTHHPIEAKKKNPGQHTVAAVDLGLVGADAIAALKFFLELGYVGIGVKQKKGSGRFVHVDCRRTPALWSY